MKKSIGLAALLLGFLGALGLAGDKEAGHGHVVVVPDKIEWKASQALPPGAMLAVLAGDPGQAGPFVMRVKLPDGGKVAPHWHPHDENVTVIQGTFMIGAGEKFDATKLQTVPAGGFMHMPKEMRHFAAVKGETILQVHGTGPFEINYVNPADDPRKK
jgi:quercetin dioxygenase-like cupin family protein